MNDNIFSDEYFMNEAIKEANKALHLDEVPVGAIIVCENNIIARSHNYSQTLNDATAHAEMQAFTSASNYLGTRYLNKCTLYVTLEPCVMCAGAAFWTQLNRLVYAADDEKAGFSNIGSNILHPKTKVESGVFKNECSKILKEFFNKKR